MSSRQDTLLIIKNQRGKIILRNQQQEAENIESSTPRKKCQISEIISKQVGVLVCVLLEKLLQNTKKLGW